MIQNDLTLIDMKVPALTPYATPDEILEGEKAYSGFYDDLTVITGTMPNKGNQSATLNCGESYTIPLGYHTGGGKITVNSLASQTNGTATAADIASGKTAWVNGIQLTGIKLNSIFDMAYNGDFYSSANQYGNQVVLHYKKNKVPNEFLYYRIIVQYLNAYQYIMALGYCTVPNLGSNGSATITLYTRQDSARSNSGLWGDGTDGKIIKGTEKTTSYTINYSYEDMVDYVRLTITNFPQEGTGGYPPTASNFLIPIY